LLSGNYNYLVALAVLCAGCLCSIRHDNNIDNNNKNMSNNVNKGKRNVNVNAW